MDETGETEAQDAGRDLSARLLPDGEIVSRRDFLALTVGGVTAALVTSCGGGGDNSGGGEANIGAGSVVGWLYRDASAKLQVGYSAAAPTGGTAVPGARVTIAGTPSAATTAADGSFTITGVPAGLATLKAQLGADTLQVPLTVINKAAVVVGNPPVTRAAASVAAKAEASKRGDLTHMDILAPQQPLPAAVEVLSTLDLRDGVPAPVPITFATPQWLYYVDLSPEARWMHDVLFVFVDAVSGVVSTRNGTSWPALNHCSYYALADANKTSPDVIQAGTRASVPVSASETRAAAPDEPTRDHLGTSGCDNPQTWALMVRGDVGAGFEYDVPRMKTIFGSAPFPAAAQIYELICPGPANPKAVLLGYLADIVKKAKACDYVVVYITSHGSRPPGHQFLLNSGTTTAANGAVIKNYQYVSPTELDFSDCKGCHIVVIVDTCYSGNWIPLTKDTFQNMNGREVVLLTAADTSHVAYGRLTPQAIVYSGKTISVPRGGLFTSLILSQGPAAFTTPMLDTDLSAVYGLAVPLANVLNRAAREGAQSPQTWQRTLIEGEKCESGTSTVTIK